MDPEAQRQLVSLLQSIAESVRCLLLAFGFYLFMWLTSGNK